MSLLIIFRLYLIIDYCFSLSKIGTTYSVFGDLSLSVHPLKFF